MKIKYYIVILILMAATLTAPWYQVQHGFENLTAIKVNEKDVQALFWSSNTTVKETGEIQQKYSPKLGYISKRNIYVVNGVALKYGIKFIAMDNIVEAIKPSILQNRPPPFYMNLIMM